MRQSVVEVRQSVLEEVTVCSRGGETVCSRGGETVLEDVIDNSLGGNKVVEEVERQERS